MIIEALQTGAVGYTGVAVLLRAFWYVASLGAAGLGFFGVLFAARQHPDDRARLRRWRVAAAAIAVPVAITSLVVQVGVLADGGSLLDGEIWQVVLASRAALSYGMGAVGLLLAASIGADRRWTPVLAAAGVAVCVSFTLLGHTTVLSPRPLLVGVLTIHLVIAAFWIGSLPPLAWAARRGTADAAVLVEDWARLAAFVVPVLLVAGVGLGWAVLGSVRHLLTSWYGWALLAKISLVGVLLGFGAWHRWRLTPALRAGAPRAAGRHLARSIAAEAVVALLVLYAAAEMVSTSPESVAHGMR